MTGRLGKRVAVVTAGILAVTLIGSATATAVRIGGQRSADLTSVALPNDRQPTVEDRAIRVDWKRARKLQADTTATGSANCAGCEAESTAFQVLYVGWSRSVELNNVATAWASDCDGCRSSGLSVQVVIARSGGKVVANNRAFAVNAACTGCGSAAAAYQLVVVTDRMTRLSRDEMAQLRAWVDEQAAALADDAADQGTDDGTARRSAPDLTTPPASDLSGIEHVVTDAVNGTTLVADADVRSP